MLLQACTTPAFTDQQFSVKATETAISAVSHIETVRLSVETAVRHGLPANPVEVAISDAEEALGAVTGTFASVQPPSEGSDRLRTDLLDLLSKAEALVENARIEFRRGDREAAARAAAELGSVASQIERFAQEHG